MSHTVFVRDVVREGLLELPLDELVLRVPYDLFAPSGAVRKHGSLIDWTEAGVSKSGRFAPTRLRDTHPGERVLIHLSTEPEEWWLCEVESVDGAS